MRGVFEKTVERIEHFVRKQEEELSVEDSVSKVEDWLHVWA